MASKIVPKSSLRDKWRKTLAHSATPRIAVAVGCFLLIFGITANYLAHPRTSSLEVGDVARKDYVALARVTYVDSEATNQARLSAAAGIPEVFGTENTINTGIIRDSSGFFQRLNELAGVLQQLRETGMMPPGETEESEDETLEAEPEQLEPLTDAEIQDFEEEAITELLALLDSSLQIQPYLVDPVSRDDMRKLLNMEPTARENLENLIDRSIRERIIDVIHIADLAQTLEQLRTTIVSKVPETGLTQDQERIASLIAKYFIRPNARIDETATQTAREAAMEETLPVIKEVMSGQIFLRSGEIATQEDLDIMNALGMSTVSHRSSAIISILLFVLILAFAFILGTLYLAPQGSFHLDDQRYYLLFYTISTISYLSSLFLIQWLSPSTGGSPNPFLLSLASLPVIGAAVIYSYYFTRLLSIAVSGFLAVLVTLAAGEPAILLPSILPSIAAGLAIKRDCPKPVMIRAIIILPIVWAVALLAQAYTAGLDISFVFANSWLLLMGIVPAPIALVLANYVLDAAFNIPTASRLQEFDNQDHPLLRKLQLDAPGTWHHSMMVGLIAEAACQAIGGNATLVRVACMYHDIGKTRRPEFFIENQRGGTNVHDKYSPWLSKIIVESHVKDGITMAKASGLPKELINMIPQHHGTCVIAYFFRKALAISEDGYVNEYDYRYPGPKPQSLEAACINLADASESAVRSLEEPTPHRIETLVNKIYEDRLLDGQYDECGLALNQLETIKNTIIDRLTSAYHTRIEYPEEEELKRQFQLKRAEGDKSSRESVVTPDTE